MICTSRINLGIVARIVITIITFYLIKTCSKFNNKYRYLTLAAAILILDIIDGRISNYNNRKCTHTIYYQAADKIIDWLTYLLIYLIFKEDNLYLYFLCYRLIGVLLFLKTRKSLWLIIMFDFIKEYLIYKYLFGSNNKYIPIFIVVKICIEYVLHKLINPSDYNDS